MIKIRTTTGVNVMEASSSRGIPPITRRQRQPPANGSTPSHNDATDEVLSTELGPTEYVESTL